MIRIVTTKGEAWCYDNNERIVARERRSRRPEWCYARPINDVSIGMWFYANSNSGHERPQWRKILDIQKLTPAANDSRRIALG